MKKEKKEHIVVIEDNEIFRDIIIEKLNTAGYSVSFLNNNATVDDMKSVHPQLLLVDVVQPKGKGLRLIEAIRHNTELSEVSIIAIVKIKDSVLASHAKELGVDQVIDKVIFDADDMLKKIAVLLNGENTDKAEGVSMEPLNTKSEKEAVVVNTPADPAKTAGRVLLIEDDAFMRGLFTQALREAGFIVDDAEDAMTGEDKLAQNIPDVILLDLLLPGKSGFQFLSETKRKEKFARIPVIVVSNLGGKGDIDHALDLGAADFLVKANSTINEILLKIKTHIEKSRRTPSLPKSIM